MAKKSQTPAAVAWSFLHYLCMYLTDEQLREVQRRNLHETDSNVCHSHDFCDANEAMLEAMADLEISMDMENAAHVQLWNEGWRIARGLLASCRI